MILSSRKMIITISLSKSEANVIRFKLARKIKG